MALDDRVRVGLEIDIMGASEDARTSRNAERTRGVILDAAVEALATHGTGISLAAIAQRAGVSKGGLLHHFPSKDALILALVEDSNRKFREHVAEFLDLSENEPGKMLRAYVRALCSGGEATTHYFTTAPAWAGIYQIPEIVALSTSDAAWWETQLALDGLSPERIMVVRHAAEGVAASVAYGENDAAYAAQAERLLLGLTRGEALPE
ncbi:TetR/AcrR family transcriptional regulator [Microbacterium sp. PF5]|uniref:TetR/AcrR family transcriptional regulator n=1 Tax=Microbacterium sp. PF5 TaxID=2305435 RepID=UPI00109BDAA6|nr:TetR/AcrR family transcriptional regulator [Microbacterium sp. PF5]